MTSCPLCGGGNTTFLHTAPAALLSREFHHCHTCDLRFVPRAFHLGADEERDRYEQHRNEIGDPRYREFLSPVREALRARVAPGSHGLDFGAGPGPALAAMLTEDGFRVALYDKYFHANTDVLSTQYDFITCTETAEHLTDPAQEFTLLAALLKPGGWLAVMSGRLNDWSSFGTWYYHRDPTHVAFYSEAAWLWLAGKYHWECVFPAPNVTLFHSQVP